MAYEAVDYQTITIERRGHVAIRADDVHDFRRVAARDAFEFAIGEHSGIADDATLGTTKGFNARINS